MSSYLLVNTKKNIVENIVSWDGDTEINWGDNLILVAQSKDRVFSIGDSYTDHIKKEKIIEKPANRNTEPEVFPEVPEAPKALHAAGEEPKGTVFTLMNSTGDIIAQQSVRPTVTKLPEELFWIVFDPSGQTYPLE